MIRLALPLLGVFALVVFAGLGSLFSVGAKPSAAGTPSELVSAVNALRAAYSLPPYTVNPILMYTAQAQADYLAATGTMTHAGPGGIGLTDRLLAAGYPLAGDLSLGGFRAENITGGLESMPAEAAVKQWTGDSLHLDTMTSPYLTEIGAGVAVSNGRVYYVIDCALPTTSGAPQIPGAPPETAVTAPATLSLDILAPVTRSTPDAAGNVIHEVKAGETLWQIAIAYGVKIEDIKSLNNLPDENIFPGNMLLIQHGLATAALPLITSTLPAADTTTNVPTLRAGTPAPTLGPTAALPLTTRLTNNARTIKLVLGIIAIAIVGGGLFAYLGTVKKE